MKRYLKLYGYFVKFSILSKLEYRLDFIANVVRSIGWFFVAILSFNILFSQTSYLAGWNRYEVLTLYGVYMCLNELWYALFFPNLMRFPDYIETGEFDFILLKPISSQFLVSLRTFMIYTIPNIFIALVIIAINAPLANPHITILYYLGGLLLMANGLMVIYSIMFMIITLTFWIVRLHAFWELYNVITEGARYPVDVFKNPIRFIFTFAIPIAVIFTIPAQFMVKSISPLTFLLSLCIGLFTFIASYKFFRFGIKHYNSASS